MARDIVLSGIREALPTRWPQKVDELKSLVGSGHRPSLTGYLDHTGLDLEDVYANDRCWSDLVQAAGLPVAPSGAARGEPASRHRAAAARR